MWVFFVTSDTKKYKNKKLLDANKSILGVHSCLKGSVTHIEDIINSRNFKDIIKNKIYEVDGVLIRNSKDDDTSRAKYELDIQEWLLEYDLNNETIKETIKITRRFVLKCKP